MFKFNNDGDFNTERILSGLSIDRLIEQAGEI